MDEVLKSLSYKMYFSGSKQLHNIHKSFNNPLGLISQSLAMVFHDKPSYRTS